MASADLEGFQTKHEKLGNAHEVNYEFEVDRLDCIQRKFRPLEYDTECPVIPTSWKIHLKYKRIPENDDTCTFWIKVKRRDSMFQRVRAYVYVSLKDAYGFTLDSHDSDDKPLWMKVRGDKLTVEFDSIPPEELDAVAIVTVVLIVGKCHLPDEFHLPPKVDMERNIIPPSQL